MKIKTERLYRVEIIKPCDVTGILFGGFYPAVESDENIKKNWGVIPPGIQGWVIKKWGRSYFLADEDQPGIDLFTPNDQPHVLISY